MKCFIDLLLVRIYSSVCVSVLRTGSDVRRWDQDLRAQARAMEEVPHILLRVVTWLSWLHYRSSLPHLNLSLIKTNEQPDDRPNGLRLQTIENQNMVHSDNYRLRCPVVQNLFWPKRAIRNPIVARVSDAACSGSLHLLFSPCPSLLFI